VTRQCEGVAELDLAAILQEHPDLVILSNRDLAAGETKHGAAVESAAWIIEQLVEADLPVLVIRDTPAEPSDRSIPNCLLTNRQDPAACGGPRQAWVPLDPWVEAAERFDSADVGVADFTNAICDAETCHAVVGGVVVYVDDDHLTETFADTMAPQLLQATYQPPSKMTPRPPPTSDGPALRSYAATTAPLCVSVHVLDNHDAAKLVASAAYAHQAVESYKEAATSPVALTAAAQELDPDWAAASLTGKVTATSTEDTSVLTITATDSDPKRAAAIPDAVAAALAHLATEQLDPPGPDGASAVTITQLGPALRPTTPQGMDRRVIVVLGALAGLAAGVAFAVGRAHLKDPARFAAEPEELESGDDG
jgi:capsular polysaccharide biosynthesis protein